jgi:hypothetical protein
MPGRAPASTTRSSSSPTSPLQEPSESGVPLGPGSAPGSGSVVVIQAKRTGLYITIGVLLILLFAAGVTAAYYIGRGEQHAPPTDTQKTPGKARRADRRLTPRRPNGRRRNRFRPGG